MLGLLDGDGLRPAEVAVTSIADDPGENTVGASATPVPRQRTQPLSSAAHRMAHRVRGARAGQRVDEKEPPVIESKPFERDRIGRVSG